MDIISVGWKKKRLQWNIRLPNIWSIAQDVMPGMVIASSATSITGAITVRVIIHESASIIPLPPIVSSSRWRILLLAGST